MAEDTEDTAKIVVVDPFPAPSRKYENRNSPLLNLFLACFFEYAVMAIEAHRLGITYNMAYVCALVAILATLLGYALWRLRQARSLLTEARDELAEAKATLADLDF